MKRWLKILLILIGLGILAGGIMVYRIYNKPHPDVTKEKGVELSAQNL